MYGSWIAPSPVHVVRAEAQPALSPGSADGDATQTCAMYTGPSTDPTEYSARALWWACATFGTRDRYPRPRSHQSAGRGLRSFGTLIGAKLVTLFFQARASIGGPTIKVQAKLRGQQRCSPQLEAHRGMQMDAASKTAAADISSRQPSNRDRLCKRQ